MSRPQSQKEPSAERRPYKPVYMNHPGGGVQCNLHRMLREQTHGGQNVLIQVKVKHHLKKKKSNRQVFLARMQTAESRHMKFSPPKFGASSTTALSDWILFGRLCRRSNERDRSLRAPGQRWVVETPLALVDIGQTKGDRNHQKR